MMVQLFGQIPESIFNQVISKIGCPFNDLCAWIITLITYKMYDYYNTTKIHLKLKVSVILRKDSYIKPWNWVYWSGSICELQALSLIVAPSVVHLSHSSHSQGVVNKNCYFQEGLVCKINKILKHNPRKYWTVLLFFKQFWYCIFGDRGP